MRPDLKSRMNEALKRASADRELQRLTFEFGDMIEAIAMVARGGDERPPRTVQKARAFLQTMESMSAEQGANFWQLGFLMNLVGEAVVRTDYVAAEIVEFLRKGLYLYGIRHAERHGGSQTFGILTTHAELVIEVTGRVGMRAMRDEGKKRLAAGRPFCLVHYYVNLLRKHHWVRRRRSQDACDISVALPSGRPDGRQPVIDTVEPERGRNPVQLMLHVFATRLTEEQQRVFLARHLDDGNTDDIALDDERLLLESLVARMVGDDGSRKMTWISIARSMGTTEKTAKREYLRALTALLAESSREMFGDAIPSAFVRRVLSTLRRVIEERDLRIRDHAGEGLSRLVDRWEIALRYVLNHARHGIGSGGDEGARFASG